MSTFEVHACSLTVAAAQLDQVATAMAGMHAEVRVHGCPDTGRAETRVLLADTLERLVASLRAVGTAAALDADRLRAAASVYAVTDGQVIR